MADRDDEVAVEGDSVINPLDYATPSPRRRRWPLVLYQLAMIGWAGPALIGVVCFIGFAISRWDVFAIFGFFTLIFGIPVTLIAFLCGLCIAAAEARPEESDHRRKAMLASLLPLSNLPLAIALVWVSLRWLGAASVFDGM